MTRARTIAKELGWTAGPPLLVALLLGLLTSSATDRLTANHSEPVATGEICNAQGCVPISRGEWELDHLMMLQGEKWMLVTLVAYVSVGAGIVRWLTLLYRRLRRRSGVTNA